MYIFIVHKYFKNCNKAVHDYKMVKGHLTGCSQHGYSLVSFFLVCVLVVGRWRTTESSTKFSEPSCWTPHIHTCQASLLTLLTVTHEGSAIASITDLVTVAQENSTNHQVRPPLGLVTVSQKRELHELNSRTEHGTFINPTHAIA